MRTNSKIICTLGPASHSEKVIYEMAKAGMAIARINFSHGDHVQHQKTIDAVRHVNKKKKTRIKLLQDLEGYRIRIGHLKKPIELQPKDRIRMSNASNPSANVIPLDYTAANCTLKKGLYVFIDDGLICLRVTGSNNRSTYLEVINGGILKSRKGVNIPSLKLKSDILTEKDQEDIAFGIKNEFDYVAQSFVRNKMDIKRVSQLIRPHLPQCRMVAKIENRDGIKNLDSIVDACDGVIVARGDLGVSLPIYKIPMIQKKIINYCNRQEKMVITATQMLESMTHSPRPTRAEVGDVANAIIDGSNFVMLSGETAVGEYPEQSVSMMKQVICYTEKTIRKSLMF